MRGGRLDTPSEDGLSLSQGHVAVGRRHLRQGALRATSLPPKRAPRAATPSGPPVSRLVLCPNSGYEGVAPGDTPFARTLNLSEGRSADVLDPAASSGRLGRTLPARQRRLVRPPGAPVPQLRPRGCHRGRHADGRAAEPE
ncbi:hypothetical protein GCM10009816_16280 [Microbacterium aquimaris]